MISIAETIPRYLLTLSCSAKIIGSSDSSPLLALIQTLLIQYISTGQINQSDHGFGYSIFIWLLLTPIFAERFHIKVSDLSFCSAKSIIHGYQYGMRFLAYRIIRSSYTVWRPNGYNARVKNWFSFLADYADINLTCCNIKIWTQYLVARSSCTTINCVYITFNNWLFLRHFI